MANTAARDLPTPVPSPNRKVVTPASRRRGSFRWPVLNLHDDVDLTYTYVPLLLYCVVSGICDSVAFNAAGVFVSMQTGNTIFLSLGASHLPAGQPRLWLKAIVSIACFQAGCFLFAHFHRLGGRIQRKILLFVSALVQALFVVAAAALAQARVAPAFGDSRLSPTDTDPLRAEQADAAIVLLPVALLAFQFGGQVYTSRVLGFSEVPTSVLTSLYCDLFSDPLLFGPLRTNAKRNRRLAAIVLTVCGGIAAGWLQRSRAGMSGALWIAAGIKLIVSMLWLAWPRKSKP
ncbi:DUF1275 domain containing protein [Niveomyces insectorum RCEF 264]|uniref:DUF1275 domain containing protein n=1 Tax=Niveomyces insectorum RCEF 264 TaxID=1081102 RepID=A0A167T921_9HYPO|nr:DUF1275 domain containing protein [Niveomyces insectorum RCEF 264]